MNPLPRLQKILADMGVASRREAERLILEGRVLINGRPAKLGNKADPSLDSIKLNGRRLSALPPKVYLLLNKPKKVMTTVDDPEGRTTVMDLCKKSMPRLFPVGRLDYDAEGVLLLTNDGELAHRLTHPSFRIPRTYLVKVKGKPTPDEIRKLREGIPLEDGPTAPCRISPWKRTEENLWVEMTLQEGRNRQVKRMWERIGYPVLKLKRVGFAGLTLGSLKPGESRVLNPEEVKKLWKKGTESKKEVVSSPRWKRGKQTSPRPARRLGRKGQQG